MTATQVATLWSQGFGARNSASLRRWFNRSLLKRTATKCALQTHGTARHSEAPLKAFLIELDAKTITLHHCTSRGGSRSSKASGSPPQLLSHLSKSFYIFLNLYLYAGKVAISLDPKLLLSLLDFHSWRGCHPAPSHTGGTCCSAPQKMMEHAFEPIRAN